MGRRRARLDGRHGRRGGKNVGDARKRLAAALEQSKEIYGRVQSGSAPGQQEEDDGLLATESNENYADIDPEAVIPAPTPAELGAGPSRKA